MNAITPKLASVHVVALILWMENTQNFFGMVGAILGCITGIMLFCINWEKFLASPPVRWLRRLFR